jgi:transcriptional regulator with XRE-family HTH domain
LSNMTIAEKIKRLRRNKNITLKSLAAETGLTIGYLSRIENSQTIPPIPTLDKIARGLGVDTTYILLEEKEIPPGEQDPNFLFVKKKRITEDEPSVRHQKGYQFESLATEMRVKNMHPYLIVGDREFGEAQQHEGEEFIYVIEGTLEFLHGSNKYILEKGDCAYFYANIPHSGKSVGEGKAEVLTVIYDYKKHERRA